MELSSARVPVVLLNLQLHFLGTLCRGCESPLFKRRSPPLRHNILGKIFYHYYNISEIKNKQKGGGGESAKGYDATILVREKFI